MENTAGWAEMQRNPPVNLVNPRAQAELYAHHLYQNAQYAAYYAHPQNPNPIPIPIPDPVQSYSTNALDATIHPPGVDPYATVNVNSYPDTFSRVSSGPEVQQLAATYAYIQTVASGSTDAHAYYPNSNVIKQLASNPFVNGVTVPPTITEAANATSSLLTKQIAGSQRSSTWKKGPKKVKVVQSAWCEICKVDCNSKSVLDQHKLGKKHKKNLEKLIVANASVLAPAPAPTTAPTPNNSETGTKANLDKVKSTSGQKPRKKAAEAEDLETKRRKILEGGAAVEAVRMCTVCNVVCNSETVFRYHLAGQKHAAMMKKHVSRTGMAAVT